MYKNSDTIEFKQTRIIKNKYGGICMQTIACFKGKFGSTEYYQTKMSRDADKYCGLCKRNV